MTRFDWHIIRRIVTAFLFFVAALILFFVVLHYVEHSDEFADGGAAMSEVFLVYYPNYIPEIIRLISPLAIFLACVYITGKLAQELQLVALQTSGVSLYRLLVPYLCIGVFLTGFMFWFNGWVVPKTNETVLDFEFEYIRQSEARQDVSGVHRQNRPGQIVTVGYYDERDSLAYRVSLQEFEPGGHLVSRIDAVRMRWIDSLRVWRLEDATERHFAGHQLESKREGVSIDTVLQVYPRDFARTARDVEAMTIPEAQYYIASLQRSGASNTGRPMVAFYNKFTYPLANLILVLISLPLAGVRMRGGQAVRFGIGMATAFTYLAMQKLTEPFGYSGALSPLFTSWFPHAIFLLVAVVLLWRARK